MLTIQDIIKLTNYQLEVFKDVFATKEDLAFLNDKTDQLLNSVDGLTKISLENTQELKAIRHGLQKHNSWIVKAAEKIDLPYEI